MANKLDPLVIGDLEIKVPIIQGAMGIMVSTAILAGSVANCGAAGTIASVGLGFGTDDGRARGTERHRAPPKVRIAASRRTGGRIHAGIDSGNRRTWRNSVPARDTGRLTVGFRFARHHRIPVR